MSDFNIRATVDAGDALRQLGRVQDSVKRVGSQVDRASGSLRRHSKEYNRSAVATNKFAKGALQQAGYQVGDFAVQVANGTSSIQAFGQQGSQLLGIFGPIGAVLGAAVAIISAIGVAAEKSEADLSQLSSVLGVMKEPLQSISGSFSAIRDVLSGGFQILIQSVDTLIIFLGLLLARFVAMRAVALASTVALTTKGTAMQYVALQTALAGRALTTYETLMVGAKAVTISFGATLATVGKILMRFLPVALLVGVAYLIEAFIQLKNGAGSFGEVLKLVKDIFAAFLDRTRAQLERMGKNMQSLGQSVKAMFFALMEMVTQFIEEKMNQLITKVNGILAKFNIDPIKNVGNGISQSFAEARDAAQNAIIAIEAEIVLLDEKIEGSSGKIKEAFEALKQAYKDGAVAIDLSGLSLDKLGKKGEDIVPPLTQAQKELKSIADSMQSTFESGFMSIVDGTKSVKDAFKMMARDVINQLYRVLVVQRMVGSFDARKGTGTGLVGAIMGIFGGFKANGGPVQANTPYVVGERGPEMFIPSRSGSIVPNDKLGGGGNVIVNQTINVSTGVQQTVRTEIKSLMPQIAESAKSAVMDAKRRGGSYGRSFA